MQHEFERQRVVIDRLQELERFRAAQEDERNIAIKLINKLINTEKLNDPAVSLWISPAELFSGDLIAVARTPSGALHLLLADGTSHGLVAAINTIPLIGPFYGMTDKGYPIDAIAAEINGKLKAMSEISRFVASTLVSIDFNEGVLRIWNGGNPPALLLAPDGAVAHEFHSRHLPLGILDPGDFDGSLETYSLRGQSQLAIYSDGLLEAVGASGSDFGDRGLHYALAKAPPAERMSAVICALDAHLQHLLAHDDISIALVDCSRHDICGAVGEAKPVHTHDPGSRSGQWRFQLTLSHRELQQADIVPLLMNVANQLEPAEKRSAVLFVVLSELYNNALEHGLLKLDSRLKAEPDGMEKYYSLRQEHLQELHSGEIEFHLEKYADGAEWSLKVRCRDSGEGYDVARKMSDIVSDDAPHGRGLLLLKSIAKRISHNEVGNEVTVII